MESAIEIAPALVVSGRKVTRFDLSALIGCAAHGVGVFRALSAGLI
jgi:hypothetical protein